jgi:hypothetical protein
MIKNIEVTRFDVNREFVIIRTQKSHCPDENKILKSSTLGGFSSNSQLRQTFS